MSSDVLKPIADDSFSAEVLNADTRVLLDDWAEWCGPCKMIEPMLEEVSRDYEGKVRPSG